MFTDQYPIGTHARIPATTGGGKSKLTEYFCRDHNLKGAPVIVVDAKETTYYGMLNYYARLEPDRETIVINPTSSMVTPLRFFHPRPRQNVSAHASRVAEVILNALGTENISDVPRYRRMVNMLTTYCAVSGKPIGQAMEALYWHNRALARAAAELMPNRTRRNDWLELSAKSEKEYNGHTESTRNRLDPFLTIDGLARIFGLAGGLSIPEAMEQEPNILVNLTPSESFPPEACRILGSYITSELLSFSYAHILDPIPYFVYLDEVELYESPDLARVLELGRGAGLRCTLIHHHAGQFKDRRLIETIEKNCRIQFVGAGTTFEEAERHIRQNHYRELNERRKKDDKIQFISEEWEDDALSITTHPDGEETTTLAPRIRRDQQPVVVGQEDYDLAEKVSMLSGELYLGIQERQFRVIEPETSYLFEVPIVEDRLTDENRVIQFEETRPYQFPATVIDQQLKEYENARPSVPKIKRPSGSRPRDSR